MVRATGEIVQLPRSHLRLPLELRVPEGFDAARVDTWPRVDGRLELVDGRLLYMPPCGDVQQDVCGSVVGLLYAWVRGRSDFVVAGNEAGMLLGDDVRAADAAIWRRADAEPRTGGLRRTPPVLAVEVAGVDEDEPALHEKARWYLEHGVEVVWLILPEARVVVAIDATGARTCAASERLTNASLPGLDVPVAELFAQLH